MQTTQTASEEEIYKKASTESYVSGNQEIISLQVAHTADARSSIRPSANVRQADYSWCNLYVCNSEMLQGIGYLPVYYLLDPTVLMHRQLITNNSTDKITKITEAILLYVAQNFPKQIVIVITMNYQLVIKSIFDISTLKRHNKSNNLNIYTERSIHLKTPDFRCKHQDPSHR